MHYSPVQHSKFTKVLWEKSCLAASQSIRVWEWCLRKTQEAWTATLKYGRAFFFFFLFFLVEAQLGGFSLFQLSCSSKVSNSLWAPIKPLILQHLTPLHLKHTFWFKCICMAINKQFCSPLSASSYLFEMYLVQRLTSSHMFVCWQESRSIFIFKSSTRSNILQEQKTLSLWHTYAAYNI